MGERGPVIRCCRREGKQGRPLGSALPSAAATAVEPSTRHATPRGRHSAESWELKEGGENPDIRGGRGREKRSRQRWVEGGRALTRRRGDELLGLGPRAAGVQWGATETPVGRIKHFALFFRSPFSCSFIFFLLLFSNVSGALPARLTLCWARSFP